jgi:signal transduction histidine kinase
LVVFFLSIVVTAWVIYLFRKGLIEPIRRVNDATFRIHSGDLTTRVSLKTGVAELRNTARSFNEMAEQLETLDQAKKDFLATISHEIKNPLAALKEGLGVLAYHGESLSSESRAKGFSACLIASKRLETMINNLLRVSRGEAGWHQVDGTTRNLNQAIGMAIEEIRPLSEKKGMAVLLDAPEDLTAAFNWDGMIQVFENLLLNAVKYGQEKTPIQIHAARGSRPVMGRGESIPHVEISVSNQGLAIPESERKRIFERFYRGSNAMANSGLGIGLHVVRRVIEAHHGEIVAECDGARTRFRFWFPEAYESDGMRSLAMGGAV